MRIVGLLVHHLLAAAVGDPALEAEIEAPEAGVIDDEVQVRPVPGRLLQIVRRARLLVEGTQRQPLVDAQVLDAELFRLFPEWIGDFFVVHEPGFLAQFGAGVHLPGVDLEVLHLAFHLVHFLRAQVRAEQAVRQQALRAGDVVNELARGHHLIGRQRVLVPVAAGHAADDGHDRVAVAEDLLHIVHAIEQLQSLVG